MFETFVVGPIYTRLGLVRQCLECRAAAGRDASPCLGFGPGCLITPRRPAYSERDDAAFTLKVR